MNPIHKRIMYHEAHKRGLNGKPDALTPCHPLFRFYLAVLGVKI